MRKRENDCLETLLGDQPVLFSEKVRFEVGVGAGLKKAHLVSSRSRLFLCRATPMGCQVTVVWYKDAERFTTGKKKGQPYIQLLGGSSRVLIEFKSKSVRERFKEACLKGVAG